MILELEIDFTKYLVFNSMFKSAQCENYGIFPPDWIGSWFHVIIAYKNQYLFIHTAVLGSVKQNSCALGGAFWLYLRSLFTRVSIIWLPVCLLQIQVMYREVLVVKLRRDKAVLLLVPFCSCVLMKKRAKIIVSF